MHSLRRELLGTGFLRFRGLIRSTCGSTMCVRGEFQDFSQCTK